MCADKVYPDGQDAVCGVGRMNSDFELSKANACVRACARQGENACTSTFNTAARKAAC